MKVLNELDIWAKGLKSSSPLILTASVYGEDSQEVWYFPSKDAIEEALDRSMA
jgi:hypothetical protein